MKQQRIWENYLVRDSRFLLVTYYDLSSLNNIVKLTKLRKLRSEASIWSKLCISIGLLLARISRVLDHSQRECRVCNAVFPKLFLMDPFRLSKITMDPHILAHVNTECLDYRNPKFDIYISELIVDS